MNSEKLVANAPRSEASTSASPRRGCFRSTDLATKQSPNRDGPCRRGRATRALVAPLLHSPRRSRPQARHRNARLRPCRRAAPPPRSVRYERNHRSSGDRTIAIDGKQSREGCGRRDLFATNASARVQIAGRSRCAKRRRRPGACWGCWESASYSLSTGRARKRIHERAPQTATLPSRLGSPAEALRGASRAATQGVRRVTISGRCGRVVAPARGENEGSAGALNGDLLSPWPGHGFLMVAAGASDAEREITQGGHEWRERLS